jgi:nicotinamidase/pyrazinamidase
MNFSKGFFSGFFSLILLLSSSFAGFVNPQRTQQCSRVITHTDALLIIDVQNDFMESYPISEESPFYHVPDELTISDPTGVSNRAVKPGTLAVTGSAQIIPHINQLTRQFEKLGAPVFLSLDWHEPEHCSFCRNGTWADNPSGHRPNGGFCGPLGPQTENFDTSSICADANSIQDFERSNLMQWPDHCIQGRFGARFSPYLYVPQSAIVVKKGFLLNKDSYSAWSGTLATTAHPYWTSSLDPSEQNKQPTLGELVTKHHINRLFVVGLATDYCVRMSSLDAIKQRFGEVVLVPSACRGVNPVTVKDSVNQMRDNGVTIASENAFTIEQIIDDICPPTPAPTHATAVPASQHDVFTLAMVAVGLVAAFLLVTSTLPRVKRDPGSQKLH